MQLLLFALLLFSDPDPFQPGGVWEYSVKHYTIEDGLPLNAVNQIVQTEDGFLYMATADGLLRFDGYEFRTYNSLNTEGLEHSRILHVGIDTKGLIWAASAYDAVGTFDGRKFQSRAADEIPGFNPDAAGPYAIARQVGKLGSSKGHAIPFEQQVYLQGLQQPIRIDSTSVRIGGQVVLRDGEFRGGFFDDERTVWVYTRNAGIYQIQRNMLRNITDFGELSIENAYSITQTSKGDIWVAANPAGHVKIADGRATVVNKAHEVDNKDIDSSFIHYDASENTLYASPARGGLWRLDASGAWEEQAWFDDFFTPHNGRVDVMHRSRAGALFIGTTGGLLIKDAKDAEKPFLLQSKTGRAFENIRTIKELKDGSLLMGSNGDGLTHLQPDWSWRHYSREDGLSSNFIRDIYVSSPDTLWLATEDHGLDRVILGPDGALTGHVNLTPAAGLLHHGLHRIIADEYGYFWINTNGGIMRVAERELHAFADGKTPGIISYNLTENSGLANREGNGGKGNSGIRLHNGLIAFPGQAGLVLINPSDFSNIAEFQLNELMVDHIILRGEQLHLHSDRSGIRLPRGQRDFRIHFTLPHFQSPQGVKFTYKLRGLDRFAKSVTNRQASYTNVPPGEYLFELTATHLGGAQRQTSLALVVPHYFYETRAFKAIIALLLLLGAFSFYRRRTKSLLANEKRMRSLLNLQTCYVVRTDLSGHYSYANPKFREAFGLAPETATGKRKRSEKKDSFMAAIVPEDRQKIGQTIQKLLQHPDKVFQTDVRMPLHDGTIAYTIWDFSLIYSKQKVPAEIQAVGLDYTRRREKERLLQESEQKLQSTVEAIPHAMLIVDEGRQVEFVNNRFEHIFGYSAEDITGCSFMQLFPKQEHPAILKHLQGEKRAKRLQNFLPAHTKSGKVVNTFLSFCHFTSAGRSSTIIILEDVSELKERQDTILRQNKALREITWHQSHSVRRPLANIMGLADFIKAYPDEAFEAKSSFTEMLIRSCNELDDIIKEVIQKSNESVQEEEKQDSRANAPGEY